MKKIFIILCCLAGIPTYATEMCARDDTVVIPLDATITSKGSGINRVEWIWWLVFDYGTIYGASACLSKKEIMMYSDWNGTGNPPQVLNTASDELIGLSDYYMNADSNSDIPDEEKPDYIRRYCFHKLTHPITNPWFYSWNEGSIEKCNANCLGNVGNMGGSANVASRSIIFNSIGTTAPWPLD